MQIEVILHGNLWTNFCLVATNLEDVFEDDKHRLNEIDELIESENNFKNNFGKFQIKKLT